MSSPFGSHRALEPVGSLPQAAWKVDAHAPLADNELLVQVDTLNIDSASFRQLEEECAGDLSRVSERIQEIVRDRGKMHNPVTGSGGMLMGSIVEVGAKLRDLPNSQGHVPRIGMRIATLVSLSLTPLRIDKVLGVNPASDQVQIEGQAVLFESGLWCPLPPDLPEEVALAALDVAGAAAQTARLVQPGDRVLILGAGGKSGMLVAYEAARRAGPNGQVFGLEPHAPARTQLSQLGFCTAVLESDATNPSAVLQEVLSASGGAAMDVCINCVNAPGTEMSCILPLKQRGKAYFFSMATSFTAAALGAEGVGQDVDMLVGNGFTRGHDLFTLQILRDCAPLRRLFEQRYAPRLLA